MAKIPHQNGQPTDLAQEEAFMRLFLQAERRILSYILTLIPHQVDAEDLLQETCTIMWRKFADFTPDTDFVAWGIAIARFRVLNYRRSKINAKVYFSEPLMLKIAEATPEVLAQQDHRIEALQNCIGRLREKDRQLIQARYFAENTTKQIAEDMGRSVDAIYKALNRIHDRLLFCIRHSQQAEG